LDGYAPIFFDRLCRRGWWRRAGTLLRCSKIGRVSSATSDLLSLSEIATEVKHNPQSREQLAAYGWRLVVDGTIS
jgi:hypothetical protein